ncbi:hypothetical protein CLIM01_12345 [Colletotrichum limetticola]|uniref:Uncharacterized protein n=1 Tax=Colletotrichum limetticola TaxID=1209924 RepID=A0ABQ9PIM9_9PEZI|nr:hypothetical protein CLIM01_12345 [Colletotrichum limetticola]
MQPARPLLILLHIVTYRTDTQYTVKRPVPHTAPSAPHLTAPHRTYNTSYTRAIPYETETRKNNLLNTPFPSQLGICRESYRYLFRSHEYLAIVVPRIPSASARLQPYAEPQNATAIPLPMLPPPHPRQSLREIDSEQTNTLFLVASHPTQRDGVNFVEVSGGINGLFSESSYITFQNSLRRCHATPSQAPYYAALCHARNTSIHPYLQQ